MKTEAAALKIEGRMTETPAAAEPARERPRWLKTLGYVAFGLFALVFWLYVTFPYDAVRRRISSEARNAGLSVQMASIGPGLFGITAKDVRISKLAGEGADAPAALQLERVALRPSLFPLGVALRANAMGGTITGSVGPLGDVSAHLELNELDPAKGNLEALTGLQLEGRLNGMLDFEIPRAAGGNTNAGAAAGGGLAFAQADGIISLDFENVVIKGGTVQVPYYGQMTPFDVPRITLGAVNGRIVFEKGAGKLEGVQIVGEDLDIRADGTIKLANNLQFSELDVNAKLKAQPEFVKRLGIIGAGLSVLPADREDPSYRLARISGFLGRPNFGPGRR